MSHRYSLFDRALLQNELAREPYYEVLKEILGFEQYTLNPESQILNPKT